MPTLPHMGCPKSNVLTPVNGACRPASVLDGPFTAIMQTHVRSRSGFWHGIAPQGPLLRPLLALSEAVAEHCHADRRAGFVHRVACGRGRGSGSHCCRPRSRGQSGRTARQGALASSLAPQARSLHARGEQRLCLPAPSIGCSCHGQMLLTCDACRSSAWLQARAAGPALNDAHRALQLVQASHAR